MAIEGQEGAQEMEALMNDDWPCIAEVTDCRDELVDIQQSFQDQKPPSENLSSITVQSNDSDDSTDAAGDGWATTNAATTTAITNGTVKSQALFNR